MTLRTVSHNNYIKYEFKLTARAFFQVCLRLLGLIAHFWWRASKRVISPGDAAKDMGAATALISRSSWTFITFAVVFLLPTRERLFHLLYTMHHDKWLHRLWYSVMYGIFWLGLFHEPCRSMHWILSLLSPISLLLLLLSGRFLLGHFILMIVVCRNWQ